MRPIQPALRRDGEKPRARRSGAGAEGPNLARLREKIAEPKVARSRASEAKPRQHVLKAGGFDPKRPELCKEGGGPDWW